MRILSLTILLVLLVPTPVQAQEYAVDKGSILLGGTASFTRSTGDMYEFASEPRLEFTLRPSVQCFILPGLAVGGEFQYQRTSHGANSSSTIAVGPAASYYFGNAESTFYPFASATLLYMNESLNVDGFGSRSTPGLGVGVSGGVAFKLSSNVALTGELFYLMERLQPDEAVSTPATDGNTFGLRVGVSTYIF